MNNLSHILDRSTTLTQADISNIPFSFTITGSNSSSAPVVINLMTDLTITQASSLFTGATGNWILNGNGHTITVDGVSNFQGLAYSINSGGTIQNLIINGINGSTLSGNAGAIARSNSGLIDHVSANLATSANGGGLVQSLDGGTISNSFATGAISGANSGGIIQTASGLATLINVYTTGIISGANSGGIVQSAGGFMFGNENATTTLNISNAYSKGDVTGPNTAGILEGFNNFSLTPGNVTVFITNTYSTGSITGANAAGIANGDPSGILTIDHAYHAGSVGSGANQTAIGYSFPGISTISNTASSASWSDTTANSALTGVAGGGPVWTDPASGNTTTAYTLTSHPGAFASVGLPTPHVINQTTILTQAMIDSGQLTIAGSSSALAPITIWLTSDLTVSSAASVFTGATGNWIINGNGHTITVTGVTGFHGLVDSINSGGTVLNLAVNSSNSTLLGAVSIAGVGAIAGTCDGLVDHASTNFTVASDGGGIVGKLTSNGIVENSFSTGAISAISAGGIVGSLSTGAVHDCYSTGVISGTGAGGIAGGVAAVQVANCYSTGAISGQYSGGIYGSNANSIVYFDANNRDGVVINSYSTGAISNGGSVITHSSNDLFLTSFRTYSTGGAAWSDSAASGSSSLSNVGSVWTDPAGSTSPFTLASHPGTFTVANPVLGGSLVFPNNPWAGNSQIVAITDDTLNNGHYFMSSEAANYGINGANGAVNIPFSANYQWFVNGVAINGATSDTLSNFGAYIGQNLSVQVTYLNGNGTLTTVSGAAATVNGVSDLAANVSTYLDAIQANIWRITNDLSTTGQFSIYDGSNTAVKATVAQLTSDADAISLIRSRSDTGGHYLVGVADTAAHLLGGLNTVIANASNLSSVTITDAASFNSISISSSQAASLKSYFSSAFGNNLLETCSTADITSLVKNTDGSLLLKAAGVLTCMNMNNPILLNDSVTNIDNLLTICNSKITTIFKSSGGINGNTIADLYTGPASLNLKYQLIEDTINAVVTGSIFNDFIKLSNANSIGKACNGGGGSDVIDGGVGSTFVTGGNGHSDTFFLDGRASGISWSTITDFIMNTDKATIWGFVKGISSVDTNFANFNSEGAAGYTGLTLHFKNLLPDGQTAGSNPNLNSITLTGHTLAELGASSLADLNTQINNGTNAHILVGATQDSLGSHSYLYIH